MIFACTLAVGFAVCARVRMGDQHPPTPAVDGGERRQARQHGFALEVMDTVNAAATFNVLSEEGRQVVAALLPLEPLIPAAPPAEAASNSPPWPPPPPNFDGPPKGPEGGQGAAA